MNRTHLLLAFLLVCLSPCQAFSAETADGKNLPVNTGRQAAETGSQAPRASPTTSDDCG